MDKLTLRGARLARELTQESMAQACGVHVNTYIAWEKEPEKVPIGKAIIICDVLGVSIDHIIFCSQNLQNVDNLGGV